VAVRGADASGSIVVEKGSAEVSSQRRAPDQESSLLGRRSDRQRNCCGIDRDIPQIFRAGALEDLRLLWQRCHLAAHVTSARSAVSDQVRCIHRHDEMLACETHTEPLCLQRLTRRQLEHLRCHRLDERDRTIEQSRWSRIAHLRLVLRRESLSYCDSVSPSSFSFIVIFGDSGRSRFISGRLRERSKAVCIRSFMGGLCMRCRCIQSRRCLAQSHSP